MRPRLLSAALLCFSAPALAGSLEDAPIDATVTVSGLGRGLGKSLPDQLTVRRIDVYAAGARILKPDGKGSYTELPRSKRMYFVSDKQHTFERLYFSLDPDGHRFEGVWFAADGIREFEGRVRAKRLEVFAVRRRPAPPAFTCQNHAVQREFAAPTGTKSTGNALTKVATHQAVVAVDTDSELLDLKFGNNTAQATTYLANLFAGMTTVYERDLDVRLMQGNTLLRVNSDPYSQSSPDLQLDEVGNHWMVNNASINRAFVIFLSGKSPSPNQSAGIAWLLTDGSYCAAKGTDIGGGQIFGHYSVSQVFRDSGSPASDDVALVGHELGHNFGAAHTHCTDKTTGVQPVASNTIDQCFNAEAGCYSGSVSCPTDNSVSGQGSIMSYCNLSPPSGASCAPNGGNILQEFHPVHQVVLDARIATNIGNGCLAAINVDRIFFSGFEN